MYCPECGKFNPDDAVFCGECGTRIEEVVRGERPKKNIGKKHIAIMIECLVCILVVTCFVMTGNSLTSAKKVAERYFLNTMNGEWSDVYDQLNYSGSEFLTKELFVQSRQHDEPVNIINYEINMQDISGFQKMAHITYQSEYGSGSYLVSLVKNQKKRYLLFDDWTVDDKNYHVENMAFVLPEGATLLIDGIDVEDYVILDEGEKQKVYSLPRIFAGEHLVEIEKDQFEPVVEILYIDAYSNYENYTGRLQVSENVADELFDKSCQVIEAFYRDAITDEEDSLVLLNDWFYQGLEDSFIVVLKDYINRYQNDGNKSKKLMISEYQGEFQHWTDDKDNIRFNVLFSYDYEAAYEDYRGKIQSSTYSNQTLAEFVFSFNEGAWMITSYNLPYINF